MYVLDSGAITMLAERSTRAAAILAVLRLEDEWPPVVPSAVLVECLIGKPDLDARTNQFLKTCDVEPRLAEGQARRAAKLRTAAGRGSAVDAIVVAMAEPGGTVVTGDTADMSALAATAIGVETLTI